MVITKQLKKYEKVDVSINKTKMKMYEEEIMQFYRSLIMYIYGIIFIGVNEYLFLDISNVFNFIA